MGISHMEGLLRVTLKESDLEQKYFTVWDVRVGEVLEVRHVLLVTPCGQEPDMWGTLEQVTVKSLSASELDVSISDSLDGMVRPLHYADIQLKKPGDRFKGGRVMKARVRGLGLRLENY